MSLLGILGIVLAVVGVWFMITGSLILGLILLVVGVVLMGGIGYNRSRL